MSGSVLSVSTRLEWSTRFWLATEADASGRFVDRMRPALPGAADVTLTSTADGAAFWSPTRLFNASASLDPLIDQARGEGRPESTVYVVTLTPDPASRSNGPAGPATGTVSAPTTSDTFEMLFRPVELELRLDASYALASVTARHDGAANRGPHAMVQLRSSTAASTSTTVVDLDWRPDWLRRARHGSALNVKPASRSRGGTAPTVVVLHATGGRSMGSSVNTFTHPNPAGTAKGIHYIVDLDGHVLKLMHEGHACNHTGPASWKTSRPLGDHAVGIEHVHQTGDVYPPAQAAASVELVRNLSTSLGIRPWNLVGHADIRLVSLAPGAALSRTSRPQCPGFNFPWTDYQVAGLAVQPSAAPINLSVDYRGYFAHPGAHLRLGDSDATRTYGGTARPAATFPTADVIATLQNDLMRIGWAPQRTATGVFDDATEIQVLRFHARFGAAPTPSNRVDAATATLIKQVVAALDAAGAP